MKRKVILALIASLTLTVGSVGTVSAMDSNPGSEVQTAADESSTEDTDEDTQEPAEPEVTPDEDTQEPTEPEVKPDEDTETSVDWTAYLQENCTMSWDFKLGDVTRGQTVTANVTVTNNGDRTVEGVEVSWIWRFEKAIEGTGDELSLQPPGYNPVVIDSLSAGESKTVTLQNTIPTSLTERANGKAIYAYAMASYKGGPVALFTDLESGTIVSCQSGETSGKKDQTSTSATVNTNTTSEATKSPKTGDAASLFALAALGGSAVTGGTAFGLRRKFKK